jgi:flagellar biosynthetic protein FliR
VSPFPLDPTAPGVPALVALLGMRVGGVLLVAPAFGGRPVPMMVRAALLVLLTVLLVPAGAAATAGTTPRVTAATLLSETLIGMAVGLGAVVFVGAAEMAGDVMSMQMGLSAATVLDPLTQQSAPTLVGFGRLLATALLFAVGGHLAMIGALAATLDVLPVGGAVAGAEGLRAMVSLGTELFTIGLRFAAPVAAALLVSNLAVGILARTMPQLNALMVAFPVQIGVGLFTLGMTLPFIATPFASWPITYEELVSRMIEALLPRVP